MTELPKKIAVIGCAHGIGKSLCEGLSSHAHLRIVDHNKEIKDLAKELTTQKWECQAYVGDLSDVRFLDQLCESLKGIESLVWVARTKRRYQLSQVEWNTLNKELAVNCNAAIYITSKLLPHFDGKDKSVIFISSVLSTQVSDESVGYHASKAALESAARVLAVEGGKYGVRVNCIRPGFIVKEEHIEKYLSENNAKFRQMVDAAHPMKEFGRCDDILEAVRYLSSSASRFMTGQCLNVDGGLSLRDGISNISHYIMSMENAQ